VIVAAWCMLFCYSYSVASATIAPLPLQDYDMPKLKITKANIMQIIKPVSGQVDYA